MKRTLSIADRGVPPEPEKGSDRDGNHTDDLLWLVVPGIESTLKFVEKYQRLDPLEDLRELDRLRLEEIETVHRVLIESNAELEQFVKIASHDLQEPLRKMIAFAELLTQDVGDLSPRARNDLDHIVDAAHRMRDLIQSLMAWSRLGRKSLKTSLVSLSNCVDRAVRDVGRTHSFPATAITCDELPKVYGDAELLTELFGFLLDNAFKFVRADEQPNVHISAVAEGENWQISVSDDGLGIDPRHFEQIFAPFKRLHAKEKYPGTGMGLTMCRKIVERHAGRIWVEPGEKNGSTFLFTLCLKPLENLWTPREETNS